MSMSVGASSNALSYLQSLLAQGSASVPTNTDPLSAFLQSLSGSASSNDAAPTATSTTPSFDPGSSFDPGTFAALISLQGQSASGANASGPDQLFAKLDTDGDGSISKSEFENALANVGVSTTDADSLFAKLDSNGDGSISESELEKAGHGHHHHHMHADAGGQAGGVPGQSPLDALLSSAGAKGATTQSTINADGSTTTTISYADGSTVEMTTPATSTSSSGMGSSGGQSAVNLIEQLIQMKAQFLNAATSTVSAVA